MSQLPDATDLLLTARTSVLEKLLPALPEALHYEARMIANALAIAAREISAEQSSAGGAQTRLAEAIRSGRHDDGSALAQMLTDTCSKLKVSNPKVLLGYPGHQRHSCS